MNDTALPVFHWRGTDSSGQACRGELQAADPGTARVLLYRRGIHVLALRRHSGRRARERRWAPVLSEERSIVLMQQLAAMLEGGLPLLKALEILQQTADRPALCKLLQEMRAEVVEGAPLSEVMARRPRCFAPGDCRLLAVGERTGLLTRMLRRACEQQQQRRTLRRRLRQALLYPAAVTVFALVLAAILLLWVTPRFAATFDDFGAQLPVLTRAVIALSEGLAAHARLLLAGLALSVPVVLLVRRLPGTRLRTEGLLWRLPLFGVLLRSTALAHFCQLCAAGLQAGVPLVEALEIAAEGSDSGVLRREAQALRERMFRGLSLSASLGESTRFPPLVRGMVAAGEQSGQLASALQFLGRHYGEEQEMLRIRLVALLEPTLIAFLGLLLGGFVLAMYLPVFQLGAIL